MVAPLLIHFDGVWTPNNTYQNYNTDGVVMPERCSYEEFYNILAHQLKVNQESTTLKIQFQLKQGVSPMNITNDMNLSFYMQINNIARNVMDHPLCVSMEDKAIIEVTQEQPICIGIEEEAELAIQPMEYEPLNMIGYVHQLTKQIMEELEYLDRDEVDIVQETEASLITDKRHCNFEEGQLFIDKATLHSALSFYALKERF